MNYQRKNFYKKNASKFPNWQEKSLSTQSFHMELEIIFKATQANIEAPEKNGKHSKWIIEVWCLDVDNIDPKPTLLGTQNTIGHYGYYCVLEPVYVSRYCCCCCERLWFSVRFAQCITIYDCSDPIDLLQRRNTSVLQINRGRERKRKEMYQHAHKFMCFMQNQKLPITRLCFAVIVTYWPPCFVSLCVQLQIAKWCYKWFEQEQPNANTD